MNITFRSINWLSFGIVAIGAFAATFAATLGLSLQSATTLQEAKNAVGIAAIAAGKATATAIFGFFTKRHKADSAPVEVPTASPIPVVVPPPDPNAVRLADLRAELAKLENNL